MTGFYVSTVAVMVAFVLGWLARASVGARHAVV